MTGSIRIVIPQTREQIGSVYAFLRERIPHWEVDPVATRFMASLSDNCSLLGAAAYFNYRKTDIEMSCAGDPGWLSRKALGIYFTYPFVQLGTRRITVICHRGNRAGREFVTRLGFAREGVHRKAMTDGGDAISYGLLREDCKWLKVGAPDGQKVEIGDAAPTRH